MYDVYSTSIDLFFYFLLQSPRVFDNFSYFVCVCVWKEIKTFLHSGRKIRFHSVDVEQKGIKTFQECGPWDFMPLMAEELDESGER